MLYSIKIHDCELIPLVSTFLYMIYECIRLYNKRKWRENCYVIRFLSYLYNCYNCYFIYRFLLLLLLSFVLVLLVTL